MKTHLHLLEGLLLSLCLSGVTAVAQNNQNFSWTVTATGTETWYSQDLIYQNQTISISMPSGGVGGCDARTWTVTATVNATAYFQYRLQYSVPPYPSGSANVYIRDNTAGVDIYYDQSSNGWTVHELSFSAIAGHTYVFTVHACGTMEFGSGGSSLMAIQFPDHYQSTPHTATRTATGYGYNYVSPMMTYKDTGGFYAPPQPQNGGAISGVNYRLSWDNQMVRLFFSDTHGTNTTNPNAHVIAAWVPTIDAMSVLRKSMTNIVFQIPQAFTSDYWVGGYYYANGVTNTFGTGPGPSRWGINGLAPGTTYTFYTWAVDSINGFNGPTIVTNVTTDPVPLLDGFWVSTLKPTNIIFTLSQPLATNYYIGGYISGRGESNYFGTGPGPAKFGFTGLTPNTPYLFSMWVNDSVNNVKSTTVYTNVTTPPMPGYQLIAGQAMGDGKMQLSFVGDAGMKYALERSSTLSPANWRPQITNTADGLGLLSFTNAPDTTTNNFWRIRTIQ